MRYLLATISCLFVHASWAISPAEIVVQNTRAVVYLEVTDGSAGVVYHGTGFVVSHDGYVITVAHLKVPTGHRIWATIGQKAGIRFPLSFRDVDEGSDVALWQLPQSAACRYAVALSSKPVKIFDRVVALGFPRNDGLTPSALNISNTMTARGFYKSDGFLQPGNSGGPVFNEDGLVVALVEGGGIPGTANNDLVPIAPAINLIRKHGVQAGIDKPISFERSCYSFCRIKANGVEKWGIERPWSAHTGWLPGGHNQGDECKALMARDLAANPDARIKLDAGEGRRCKENPNAGMCEDVKAGIVVQYMYFCKGVFRSEPTYFSKQTPACGIWN